MTRVKQQSRGTSQAHHPGFHTGNRSSQEKIVAEAVMGLVDGMEGEPLVSKELEQGEGEIMKRREGLKKQRSGQ